MTRRQVHVFLLAIGLALVAFAVTALVPAWVSRSDTLFAGALIVALGIHGVWTRDPR